METLILSSILAAAFFIFWFFFRSGWKTLLRAVTSRKSTPPESREWPPAKRWSGENHGPFRIHRLTFQQHCCLHYAAHWPFLETNLDMNGAGGFSGQTISSLIGYGFLQPVKNGVQITDAGLQAYETLAVRAP